MRGEKSHLQPGIESLSLNFYLITKLTEQSRYNTLSYGKGSKLRVFFSVDFCMLICL